MLNADHAVIPEPPIHYADASLATTMASGVMNTSDDTLLEHIKSAVRRGHPQMRTWPARGDRICLVGSGPSLKDTEEELRQLVWEGAQVVTLNGAYQWCIDHGIQPKTQIVMDARASNARFVDPDVSGCRYVLASQCHPKTWDAVDGRPDVWMWHAVVRKDDAITEFLDAYYLKQWFGIGGGTSVATRALTMLRMAGYLRFDLFGIDCCWMGSSHHAIEQPENAKDQRIAVEVGANDRPETMRTFHAAPWHIKQFEDFCTVLKLNGQHFHLNIHGDGMLAYLLRTLGQEVDPAVVRPSDSLGIDSKG
jgi:hypothetical protein